jgi:hypothetical protein
VSLGWYIAAVSACDLLFPVFVLVGIEQVDVTTRSAAFMSVTLTAMPWSHSLVMTAAWAAAFMMIARARGISRTAGWLLFALVGSHWVLDWLTHVSDMTLWPGNSPRLGLGLWQSIPGTFAVEGTMWLAGLAVYFSVRRPVGARGWVSLGSLLLVTTVLWIAGPWSPPPPSVIVIGAAGLIGGLLMIPWAAWADRSTRAVSA